MQILLNTPTLLAVSKPPGINVHEAPGTGGSVLRELREQFDLDELTPVHRLDKDASGVLLLAKSKKTASALQRVWDQVEKTYVALCHGIPSDASGIIDAPILENQTGKPERLKNALRYHKEKNPGIGIPPLPEPKTSGVHPAGRSSQTEYRLIEKLVRGGERYSLLEVTPRQGRMHQIRVHLAHIKCPIFADKLYSREKAPLPISRLALHAAKLVFPDPEKLAEKITVEAPLPVDIQQAISHLKS